MEEISERIRDGNGDPVTALWQPSGHVIAQSFPLVRDAIDWIVRLTFGPQAGAFADMFLTGDMSTTVEGLGKLAVHLDALENQREEKYDKHYSPDAPKPLMAGLRVTMHQDSLRLYAFRNAPFNSSVMLVIRPHDTEGDGTKEGPPIVGIEWTTVGPGRDEALLLPETFGAAIRNCSVAWPDTLETGLVSVRFSIASHAPLHVQKRWSLAGIEWPADRGGIVCFGGGSEVQYLVTLPKELASPLIRRIGDGSITIYGGEHFYLNDLGRRHLSQKF